jgi:1-aminocyclopropane-1-carboxylate deaminase
MKPLLLPSPIEQLHDPLFIEKDIEVYIKRDDLIHPIISGNKWRKLKFNIEKLKQDKYEKLLTFGGAYSNHIAATASTGKLLGLKTIGIIRGDELSPESNETLKKAHADGMELIFTSREEYRLKEERYYQEELRRKYGNVLIVPEGGYNYHGALGCVEILNEIDFNPTVIYAAAGTATTATGLLLASDTCQVTAVSALKGGDFLNENVQGLLRQSGFGQEEIEEKMNQFNLVTDVHFGGYGKYTQDLIDFMNEFYQAHHISLDQIYTAKMAYAAMENIKSGTIERGSKVVLLHTGGVQGTSSIKHLLNH